MFTFPSIFSIPISDIKVEPESQVDSIAPLTPENVVEVVHPSKGGAAAEGAMEEEDDNMGALLDTFCDRIQQAVAEGEGESDRADPVTAMEVAEEQQKETVVAAQSIKSEHPVSDDVAIQDSGGVFKDHNYSLFKDVNPVDQLLMTYYMSTEKGAAPVSQNNQNVCKILELLGTIVSASSTQLISGAIEMIEIYTSLMRAKFNERDQSLEKVYADNAYLSEVREMSVFLTNEGNRVASAFIEDKEKKKAKGIVTAPDGNSNQSPIEDGEKNKSTDENDKMPRKTGNELLTQLKVDINGRLREFRVRHDVIPCEEVGQQTDETPEVEKQEFSCQTDPIPIPVPVSSSSPVQRPLKYFSSSDIDTDSSAASLSSEAKRRKKRKTKKEILAGFFEREDQQEVDALLVKVRKKRERGVAPVTGSDDEIDRLINLNNLDRDYQEAEEGDEERPKSDRVTEGGPAQTTEKPPKETVEDILRDIRIDEDDSNDEPEKAEESSEQTEEKRFLKELNLEHKKLLLNSSSEDEEDTKSDSGFGTLVQRSVDEALGSSDESVIEEGVDLFLNDFKVVAEEEKVDKKAKNNVDNNDKTKANDDKNESSAEDAQIDNDDSDGIVVNQRRDSFDAEMAKLLEDTDEEEGECKGVDGDDTETEDALETSASTVKKSGDKKSKEAVKNTSNSVKLTAVKDTNKPEDANEDSNAAPLDLSDTVGKRSRNQSMDTVNEENEREEKDLMLKKRKSILNCSSSQNAEKLDALVLRAHQATKNPLLTGALSAAGATPPPPPPPRDPDCISLSSSSSVEELSSLNGAGSSSTKPDTTTTTSSSTANASNTNRNTRKLLSEDQLDINTKKAQKDEAERIKRLERKHEALKKYLAESGDKHKGEIVLDVDPKTKQVIRVHPEIVKHLKEHQVAGVKFLYDCVYGSVVDMPRHKGSGCILAHCMGLGKTLQQITVMHTVVQYPELKTNRILVICPKSTVMNWEDEVKRWIGGIVDGVQLKVYYIPDQTT